MRQKIRYIIEPAAFVLLTFVSVLVIQAADQIKVFYFHPYGVIIMHTIIMFLLGMLLNAIHRKMVFCFNLVYLVISLVCILAIFLLFQLYAYLPQFFIKNLNTIQLFLSAYSGANFVSALFKEKPNMKKSEQDLPVTVGKP